MSVTKRLRLPVFIAALFVQGITAQFCNVCRDSPVNQPARTLANPNEFFMMNGDPWTCGYLQETVRDVRSQGGAPGEARWCALAQVWAEQHCTCDGPPIPPTTDNIKDPNPACDLCPSGQFQFNYVPAVNADLTADTGVAGNMNCQGLYYAMSEGVLTNNLCPVVRANAGPICCSLESVSGSGNGGGSSSGSSGSSQQQQQQQQSVCRRPAQICSSHSDCCAGLQCKAKTLNGSKYCTSAREIPRASIAGQSVGGAAGRARTGK
ncbi:ion channel inhibitory toxin [Nitzschia inconspicua]|uniref:Ion channel inhibitory toxin n=1 Tax=Nitzschia inconspicua TaxID=303405 RepID=A0A9K3PQ29_9STRA|nr:ion channel inhibitory toxin [Nitzschia inconspicua]